MEKNKWEYDHEVITKIGSINEILNERDKEGWKFSLLYHIESELLWQSIEERNSEARIYSSILFIFEVTN